MTRLTSPIAISGVAAGALLVVHGLFPNTHSYPFLWPVVGGGLAVWLAARSSRTPPTLARDAGMGIGLGVIAALIAAVGFVVGYYLLSLPRFESVAQRLGAPGPLPWSVTAARVLALVALLAIPAALVAPDGSPCGPRRKSPH